MSSFDVVIIGSGPGGYVSAIRCAQLGFKTAIIEKYATLGGTCLNVGCIPSKALLASSHHYEELQHFADHGIEVSGNVKVNLEKMIARKQAVVDQTSGGVKFLMDKNKITVFEGLGSFVDATHVAITKADGTSETIEGKNISMRIPEGTESGQVFRLKGNGIPYLGSYGKGDQHVIIRLEIPKKISKKQKELLEEFVKESGETNSGFFKGKIFK